MASCPYDSWFIPPCPLSFSSLQFPHGWSILYFFSDTSSILSRLSLHFPSFVFSLSLSLPLVFISILLTQINPSRESAAVCFSSMKPAQQGQCFFLNCVDHQNLHDLTLPCSICSLRPIWPALPTLWCKYLSCSWWGQSVPTDFIRA